MLHIILGILKVIGILLAAVILLLLGIILAVLLIPIRYRISADKTPEQLAGRIQVTWLLRMIAVEVSYDHKICQKLFEIRIFGLTIETIKKWFSKLSKLGQKRKKPKKRTSTGKTKSKTRSEQKRIKQDTSHVEERIEAQYQFEQKQENTKKSNELKKSEIEENEDLNPKNETDIIDEVKVEDEADIIDGMKVEDETDIIDEVKVEDETESMNDVDSNAESESDETKSNESDDFNQINEKQIKYKMHKIYDKIKTVIISIKTSIQTFVQKVMDKVQAVKERIIKIQDKISGIERKVTEIPNKIERVQKLCEEYEVKEQLETIWGEFLYLIKHYAPGKVRGYLKFGTGDPAKTGQILGMLYIVLPVRAAAFSLQPEFTEAVLETEMKMTGHIRISHLAMTVWRLFRNKKLMRAIRMLRKERRK